METWDQRLRARMKEKGLSQADIKRRVKVSNYTASKWFHGEHKPEGENLVRLCAVVEASPAWLITGVEQSAPCNTCGSADYEVREIPQAYEAKPIESLLAELRDRLAKAPQEIRPEINALVLKYMESSEESCARIAQAIRLLLEEDKIV